jgi:hypothetical protein
VIFLHPSSEVCAILHTPLFHFLEEARFVEMLPGKSLGLLHEDHRFASVKKPRHVAKVPEKSEKKG